MDQRSPEHAPPDGRWKPAEAKRSQRRNREACRSRSPIESAPKPRLINQTAHFISTDARFLNPVRK